MKKNVSLVVCSFVMSTLAAAPIYADKTANHAVAPFVQNNVQQYAEIAPRENVERSLLDLTPLAGRQHWEKTDKVIIKGRFFSPGGLMGVSDMDGNEKESQKVIFENSDNYDYLELWVGVGDTQRSKTTYQAKIKFCIEGDGNTLYESRWLKQTDAAVKVKVSVRDYSGISLVTHFENESQRSITSNVLAVWASPVLGKEGR